MKKRISPWLIFLLLLALFIIPSVIAVSTVTRSFFPAAGPADMVTVRLTVDEDDTAQENALLIEEHVPLGWTVVDRKQGKGTGSRIAWAFIEGLGGTVEDTVLSYTVRLPSYSTGLFNGSYLFGSSTVESVIGGETSFGVRMPGAKPQPQSVVPVVEQPPVRSTPPAVSLAFEPAPESLPPAPLSAPAYAPFVPVVDEKPRVAESPPPVVQPYHQPSSFVSPPPRASPAQESFFVPEVPPAPPVPVETATGAEPLAVPPDVFVPKTAAPAEESIPPVPVVHASSKKSSWWLILLGSVALAGLIGGGIYLKQHPLHGAAAGSGSFSPHTVKYYIDQYTQLGYSKEQIINHLLKNGMPRDLIEHVYAEMEQHLPKAA